MSALSDMAVEREVTALLTQFRLPTASQEMVHTCSA